MDEHASHPSRYALLLDQPLTSLAPLAETMAGIRNIPFQDAMSFMRQAWGFIARNTAEGEARALSEKLAGKGIKTKLLKEPSLKALPPVQKTVSVAFSDNVLQLLLENHQSVELTGNRIALIAAAGLPFRTTSVQKTTEESSAASRIVKMGIFMTTGLPLPIGRKKKEVEKTEIRNDMLFHMDLVGVDPVFRYRLDAHRLNYSFLKERMLYNALQNFKFLLADVVAQAPRALKNKGTEVLMRQEAAGGMGYESMEDFEKESFWLWNRI